MERVKLKIQFIDNVQEPIEYDAELTHINFTFISNLLMQLRKIRKNQIEFIKYLNEDKALESIKVSTPDIKVSNLKEIIITVKLIKKEKPDPNIEAMINKVKNISNSIDNEIAELKNFQITSNNSGEILSLKSSKSNTSYNLNELSREPSLAFQDEENLDVIILTANPLCYRYESDKIKELRVMNEFNCITDQIYQVLSRTKLPIKSQFLTLTKNNLSNAINKKPKILHLICKSTYECDNYNQKSSKLIPHISEINEEIIETKKESKEDEITEPQIKKTYSPILLFENEKCQMEKITSNILTKLLKNKSDLTKDITLFISTPLSKDVFTMFTSLAPIKFKNLLVQHSTLADAVYISQFNRDLYMNLLDKKSLNDALNQAKRINFSGYQFCCCSHEHNDDNCLIKKYLSNELFREDEEETKENCDENKIQINQDIKKIPHVYHLRYKCECQERLPEKNANKNNFCYHHIAECENKTNILFGTKKVADICCCQKRKKQIQHNLNGVFQIDKTEEELKKEIIFDEYEKEKYKKCEIINKEFVPCYGKMQIKVGFNKILYRIFEFILKKNCNILNIYGNQYDALEIGNLITIIEEFIKERHSYLFLDNQKNTNFNHKESEDLLILNKKETIDLELGKKNNIKNYIKTDSLDLTINAQNSAKQLRIDFNNSLKPLLNIIKFDDIKNLGNIFTKRFDNTNKIYIINALKFNDWNSYEWIKKLRTKLDLTKIHIIIFDLNRINEKIEEDNHIEKIDYIDFDLLDKYDWMVKNQTHKIEDNKENFENKLIEKGRNLTKEDITEIMNFIMEKNKESEMYYLILYLFNCTKSGLFEFEFENLFPDKKELDEAVKIRNLYVNKKILNIETNRNTNGNLIKQQQVYIKYIKNKDFISILCDWIKIPKNIRQNLLGRLFLFYAKKFRLLLKKIKVDRNRINLQKQEINVKGYKPNDSLFSFSAIQNLGIWRPLNDSSNKFEDNTTAPIYNIEGYFNHLSRNFKDIFLNENIKLCSENIDVWNNVKEYLEDISITLLTFYKIYDKKEILGNSITKFNDLFDQFHLSKDAFLRLKLFIKMQNDFYSTDISNREKLLNDLKHIENAFTAINNKEGLLETLYAHYINEKLNERVILEKIRKILDEMKKEENKEKQKFADIFEAKINYKLLKRKIMKKSPKIEEFEDLFKKLIETFHKNEIKFYVIKTLLLKSSYYMNKIKDKINEDEYKIDFLCYFNSAYFYIDKDSINQVYIDYIKNIAHMKYNLKENLKVNDSKYIEYKKKLSKVFDNYNLGKLNEKNLFSYEE